jgi:signal peptidase
MRVEETGTMPSPIDVKVATSETVAPDSTSNATPTRSLWAYLRIGLTWGLVAVVAGLGAVTLVVPALTGSTPLAVLSPSMEPTLPVGTLVVVQPTAPRDIRLGDVITYQIKPGDPTLVTHRVVEVRSLSTGEFEYLTKGDANAATDPTVVTQPQLKGRAWYSVPLVGFVSVAVSGAVGPMLVPIVGAALLAYGAFLVLSGMASRAKKKRAAAAEAVGPVAEPATPLVETRETVSLG